MQSEVVIAPAFFGMVAFIVWTVANGWQRQQRLRVMADFNDRLIQRLGTVKDVGDFLQSGHGTALFNNFTVEHASNGVHERILRGASVGIVAATVGAGFMYLGARFPYDYETFSVFGVIALSLGAGFVVSSAVSYLLARSLGLSVGRERS